MKFHYALYAAASKIRFIRESGRYPLAGRGDVNTYAIFAETAYGTLSPHGYGGIIVPTGIATDATTQYFFADLVRSSRVASLYDFENALPLFPGVHRSYKFCLLTLTGREAKTRRARFAFFLHQVGDLKSEGATFSLTAEDIELLNPNTKTLPIFRSRKDAEITLGVYRRVPIIELVNEDAIGWKLRPVQMFDVTHDASYFKSSPLASHLPLAEGRLIHQFTHRWATYQGSEVRLFNQAELKDPRTCINPRYWVGSDKVKEKLVGKWRETWLLVWRGICRATDERTVIASITPVWATNNKIPIVTGIVDAREAACFLASINSFVLDYIDRQKQSGVNLNTFILQQLPVPSPNDFRAVLGWSAEESVASWVVGRVIELTYDTYDLQGFASDLGDTGGPFQWDEERRFKIRAELDAAFFHIYRINRDDTDYIMDSFPIVKRKDEERYGSYRTKEMILRVYDAMAEAERTGKPYQTILDPPPGQGPRHG